MPKHAPWRKSGAAHSPEENEASRYEEDLMQPGELSRVKERAPKGAVLDGRRRSGAVSSTECN